MTIGNNSYGNVSMNFSNVWRLHIKLLYVLFEFIVKSVYFECLQSPWSSGQWQFWAMVDIVLRTGLGLKWSFVKHRNGNCFFDILS